MHSSFNIKSSCDLPAADQTSPPFWAMACLSGDGHALLCGDRDRDRDRERDGDGGLGGGAAETPASPSRASRAAPLLESCLARFGERERLRDDDEEWRRFFFFFFSFFWRFFSFF